MHCNLAAIKTLSWQCYSCAEVSTSWTQPASMGSRLYVCVGPSSIHSIFKGRQVIVTRSKVYIIVNWISRVHVQFLCHWACASSDTDLIITWHRSMHGLHLSLITVFHRDILCSQRGLVLISRWAATAFANSLPWRRCFFFLWSSSRSSVDRSWGT